MNTAENKSFIIEGAAIALKTPYKVTYSIEGKTLAIDVAIHPRPNNKPNMLVYFPLKPKWNSPFENQAIAAQATNTISDRVENALRQMGFNVKFCLPMGYSA